MIFPSRSEELLRFVENEYNYNDSNIFTNVGDLYDIEDKDADTSHRSEIDGNDTSKEDFEKVLETLDLHFDLQEEDVESIFHSSLEGILPFKSDNFLFPNEIEESSFSVKLQESIEEEIDNMTFKMESTKSEQTENEEKLNTNITLPIPTITLPEVVNKPNIQKQDEINSNKSKIEKKGKDSITIKEEEQEDRIDIETISDKIPVLEAIDVDSLLEQFEASQIHPASYNRSDTKNKKTQQAMKRKQYKNSFQSMISPSQSPSLQENTPEFLSQVMDKIKTPARKKSIKVIPAIPNVENGNRKRKRMKVSESKFSRNKALNKAKSNASCEEADNAVQLDHAYCNSASSINSPHNNSKTIPQQITTSKSSRPIKKSKCNRLHNENSKKDNDLESSNLSNINEETIICEPNLNRQSIKSDQSSLLKNDDTVNLCQIENVLIKSPFLKDSYSNNKTVTKESSNKTPVVMEIRSALARGILQKNGHKSFKNQTQMVSVLKNLPIVPLSTNLRCNSDDMVTTTNNQEMKNKTQNVTQTNQDFALQKEETKRPRKLNLEQYRNRKERYHNNNNYSKQPMISIYAHHISTSTKPFLINPNTLTWLQREYTVTDKPISDIEREANLPKKDTCDVAIQINESDFESHTKSLTNIDMQKNERKYESYRGQSRSKDRRRSESIITNSRQSRNRSKIRSERSRKKNRDSRSRDRRTNRNESNSSRSSDISRISSNNSIISRSRSRRRSGSPHRRISRHCDSDSSHTSSSSVSRSRTYSRSISRTRYSHSTSSRSRLSSHSSSSHSSTYERNAWTNDYRNMKYNNRDYPRERMNSSKHFYEDWKRASSYEYHKSYNTWYNREKQRQIEERKVVYVGGLHDEITKIELRERFQRFGPIVNISIHLRERRNNYGFVTFEYRDDAYNAVEHGNDNPSLPKYDLSFGGRRAFCKVRYADLDGMANNESTDRLPDNDVDFSVLLKRTQTVMRQRRT